MKRTIVILTVFTLLTLTAFAEQGDMKLGGYLSLVVPGGDAGDVYGISPAFGANFIYGLNPDMDIEGNLGYSILQENSDFDFEGFSASSVEISGGLRYRFQPQLYGVAGLGMYTFNWEWEYNWGYGTEKISDSNSEIGLFVGGGYVMPMNSFDLVPAAKIYLIDGDLWIAAGVAFNFPIGG
jgi:hypothetical protein